MILQQMELITSTDVVRNLCKKMAPPLVTLLSAEPEIQYVALRNINLIVQKRPTILAHEIKVFFVMLPWYLHDWRQNLYFLEPLDLSVTKAGVVGFASNIVLLLGILLQV